MAKGWCTEAIAAAFVLLAACRDDGGAEGDGDTACAGPKCDDPDDPSTGSSDDGSSGGADETTGGESSMVEPACYDRRLEAFNPNRLSFTPTALRWSCADIDSTPADERGQEYCEYFAVVTLPPTPAYPDPEPSVLGRLLGVDGVDGTTPVALELDGDQIAALEASPDSIVGACVFSSWNGDVEPPCGTECEAADVLGVPIDADVFRMKFDANTNEAALQLLADCAEWLPPGDPNDPDDPFQDPFLRACQLNTEINETQHRKSDNVICGAAVRMAECGCALSDGSSLAEALAPPSDLGFRLGGWEGPTALPSGCRYQDLVDGAQAIVVCDLTAAEVLQNASEMKSWCRESFADDVVVHIAVEPAAVTCTPPEGADYAGDCPMYPWVLEP